MTFATATFRANPGYELVLLDRLSPAEQAVLATSGPDVDCYGLLRPRDERALVPRAVTHDTALLFLTLRQPGLLPAYVRRRAGSLADDVVERLVLDGVLEVQHGGRFRSGVAAIDAAGTRAETARDGGRVAAVSLAAVKYGQMLGGLDAPSLAARLYTYGRLPASPAWHRRLPDAPAVATYLRLGVPPGGWIEPPQKRSDEYWRMWRPRRRPEGSVASCKLYVSTDRSNLPDAVHSLSTVLFASTGTLGFKVGRHVDALGRPDSLVAYFSRLEDLHEAATNLRVALAGVPGRGVPFTAGITADGLLSWGRDPPVGSADTTGSWRSWITDRLALYLLDGLSGDSEEPWQYALTRMRLDGVDPTSWAPAPHLWKRLAATAIP